MKKIYFFLLSFFYFSVSFSAPVKAVSQVTIYFLPANECSAAQLISIPVEVVATNPKATGNHIFYFERTEINFTQRMI